MSKFKAFCNLFVLMFSSYKAFQNIQSTVNAKDGLGVIELCLLYSSMIIASLFLVPLTTSRFSNKWIMVISIGIYLLYLVTGLYSTWATIIPAAVLLGTGLYKQQEIRSWGLRCIFTIDPSPYLALFFLIISQLYPEKNGATCLLGPEINKFNF